MRHALIFALILLPGLARADFALTDMVGSWSGTGTYAEALSQAKMKCRLNVAGADSKVTMTGRCGSSLGASDVVMDIVRSGTGIVITGDGGPDVDTEIDQLTGQISGQQIFVTGAEGKDSVKMQFVMNADGTLYFATERKWLTGSSWSKITLVRR